MRKRLVLVVGAIALGGVGLAVPAIAGAVSGNDGPTTVVVPTAEPAAAPPLAVPAEAPPTAIPAPPSAIPAPPAAVPVEAPPLAVPAGEVPTLWTPGYDGAPAAVPAESPWLRAPGVDYVRVTTPAGPWTAGSPLDPPTPVER